MHNKIVILGLLRVFLGDAIWERMNGDYTCWTDYYEMKKKILKIQNYVDYRVKCPKPRSNVSEKGRQNEWHQNSNHMK